MSAIAGLLSLDGRPVTTSEVDAMLAAMGRRSAGQPLFTRGHAVCMAQVGCDFGRRVEKAAEAPRTTGTLGEGPTAVADARIDNAPETARTLGLPEDTRVESLIACAYDAWGPDCAQRLLGDFAVVIWDDRRRRLVCIRDSFGVRPLYCFHLPGQVFAFASEAKALLTLPGVTARIDEARVADFLAAYVSDAQYTFYEDVRRVPPAHVLTVERDQVGLRRYWSPDRSHALGLTSDAEYAAAFRDVFAEAVRCRIHGAASAGVRLSGGLDSSAVTCMARHLLSDDERRLSTFTVSMRDRRYGDERPFVAAVARAGGIRADCCDVTDRSPLRHLGLVNSCNDGPVGNSYACDFWETCSRAAGLGIDVLLDGCDGDVTVYYDFRHIGALVRSGRIPTALREARGLSRHYFGGEVATWSLLWRHSALLPHAPAALARMWRRLGARASRESSSLISAGFADRSGLTSRLERYGLEVARLRTHREVHAYTLEHPMLSHSLEYINKLCASCSVEPRHPFYDRRLVELCLALPRSQHIENGWSRPILRRALADLLPREVCQRGDKGGSAAPRRLARLERRVLEETAADAEVLGDYLDMRRLRAAIGRYIQTQEIEEAEAVWRAVSLRQWLRMRA